jgi:hypothetical protein
MRDLDTYTPHPPRTHKEICGHKRAPKLHPAENRGPQASRCDWGLGVQLNLEDGRRLPVPVPKQSANSHFLSLHLIEPLLGFGECLLDKTPG